jgi:hypothetical protein
LYNIPSLKEAGSSLLPNTNYTCLPGKNLKKEAEQEVLHYKPEHKK